MFRCMVPYRGAFRELENSKFIILLPEKIISINISQVTIEKIIVYVDDPIVVQNSQNLGY